MYSCLIFFKIRLPEGKIQKSRNAWTFYNFLIQYACVYYCILYSSKSIKSYKYKQYFLFTYIILKCRVFNSIYILNISTLHFLIFVYFSIFAFYYFSISVLFNLSISLFLFFRILHFLILIFSLLSSLLRFKGFFSCYFLKVRGHFAPPPTIGRFCQALP